MDFQWKFQVLEFLLNNGLIIEFLHSKTGPDRFKFINEVAKVLLQEQGVICPKESGKQKGKKKK